MLRERIAAAFHQKQPEPGAPVQDAAPPGSPGYAIRHPNTTVNSPHFKEEPWCRWTLLIRIEKSVKPSLSPLHISLSRCSSIRHQGSQSVQFSCSVVSDSLGPHGLQHARPPCPLRTPGVYSNSCPLSQCCHAIILSSVIPFSSCLHSFSASGSFQIESVLRIRWPKYWHFSFGISPSKEYSGLISVRMDWLNLLAVQGTLKSLLQHHRDLGPVKVKVAQSCVTLCDCMDYIVHGVL